MNPTNPYSNRWNWWYDSIIDRMIAHPDWSKKQIAEDLGKHPNTVYQICDTDLFKDYYAKRLADFRANHDFSIINKTTKVAEVSLDILLEGLQTKRTAVPIGVVNEIATSALERLGYGTQQAPLVQVNQDNRSVSVAVNTSTLEEARMAIRQVEEMKRRGSIEPPRNVGLAPLDSTVESPSKVGAPTIDSQFIEVNGERSEPERELDPVLRKD